MLQQHKFKYFVINRLFLVICEEIWHQNIEEDERKGLKLVKAVRRERVKAVFLNVVHISSPPNYCYA